MQHLTLIDWIESFLIATSSLVIILSIPSFISIYKLGFKSYVQQLTLFKTISKKISTGYKIVGPSKSISYYTHFFPIIINVDNILIISKKERNLFFDSDIQFCKHIDDKWVSNEVKIKANTCLFTHFLNDRIHKKVNNLMRESVQLEDVENLNQLLNSQITSIKREDKLQSILQYKKT